MGGFITSCFREFGRVFGFNYFLLHVIWAGLLLPVSGDVGGFMSLLLPVSVDVGGFMGLLLPVSGDVVGFMVLFISVLKPESGGFNSLYRWVYGFITSCFRGCR